MSAQGGASALPEAPRAGAAADGQRAFVDLHCHTAASFDSLAAPGAVMRAAASRGITHLAITDHDRIDGAAECLEIVGELRAAARKGDDLAAAHPLPVLLVGQEIRTTMGDLIGVFLREAVPTGLSPVEAIAAVREQGGLVGIAHPFDRFRGSIGRGEAAALEQVASAVDWIEAWNARLMLGDGNARAAELAKRLGKPGVAVSDAHTTLEVGVAATIVRGDPSTPEGLRGALAGPIELTTGRASRYVRLLGPAAKVIQRLRGRGRVRPARAAR